LAETKKNGGTSSKSDLGLSKTEYSLSRTEIYLARSEMSAHKMLANPPPRYESPPGVKQGTMEKEIVTTDSSLGSTMTHASRQGFKDRLKSTTSNIHKISSQQYSTMSQGGLNLSRTNPSYGSSTQESHQTHEEFSVKTTSKSAHKPKSYFQKIVEGDYRDKNDPQYSEFIAALREQFNIAKRVRDSGFGSIVEKKNTVRLKRDFKKLKTIILDLDETLIHSEDYVPGRNYDYIFMMDNLALPHKKDEIGVFFRPYLMEFLERLSKKFELVIFTAGRQDYADHILDKLDPENKYFAHRLYRQHCDLVDGNSIGTKKDLHIKCLQLLSNRKREDLLIVDNLIYSYSLDIENGIPIRSYINGKTDCELEYLADALSDLKSFMDSRLYIREKLRLDELNQFLSQ
jgi:Dullard-like phosphatase family protein